LWIDSFLPIFLLLSFYFSYQSFSDKETWNLFLSGLFLGIGIVFKQVVVPVAGIVAFVFLINKKTRSKFPWFLAGVALLPGLMVLYFINMGVFQDFWYWTVTYNLTTFSKFGRKLPTFTGFTRVLAVYSMVVFSWLTDRKKIVFWITIFLLGGLLSAYARFDFVHFQPSLPFVCLGTVVALDNLRKHKYLRYIIAGYIAVVFLFLSVFYHGHIGSKVFFFDDQTKSIAKTIRDLTEPRERIYIFGSIPHLYQMSDTLPAGSIYIQQFSWFMMVSEDRILESLKSDMPNLVVADRSVHVDGKYIVDYASEINKYLLLNYQTVSKIGTTEFLLKK
jgi:hypothetical protein